MSDDPHLNRASIWTNDELWSKAFAVGDSVRVAPPTDGVATCGVVKDYSSSRGSKAWIATVQLTDGSLLYLRPQACEKISMLEVLAEAAQLSPLQVPATE